MATPTLSVIPLAPFLARGRRPRNLSSPSAGPVHAHAPTTCSRFVPERDVIPLAPFLARHSGRTRNLSSPPERPAHARDPQQDLAVTLLRALLWQAEAGRISSLVAAAEGIGLGSTAVLMCPFDRKPGLTLASRLQHRLAEWVAQEERDHE